MKQLACLISLISLPFTLLAADAKFPFPNNCAYKYGIMPKNIDHESIQISYDKFIQQLYEEQGDLARIKHDNRANTVSEGIAYGMLIMVYMDNATNKTQSKFDKLWNYYKKFPDKNGLMNWKTSGFNNVIEYNAATDAEVDAALALLQAYKQWGDEKYLNDAKSLIGKISSCEVNGNGYLKPGDSWDDKKNPSYFSIVALELFKKASSFDWGKVITNSYALIKKTQKTPTGLVPDWCSENGDAQADYSYDATRTPWRIAWAYSWFGHQDAKDICTKIASWISTKYTNDPTKIVDGYKIDGSETSKFHNEAFVGPFTCAGMVDAIHQAWVDKSYAHLDIMGDTVYYKLSLKVLTILYLSGNMPNLWDYPPSAVEPAQSTNSNCNILSFDCSYLSTSELSFTTTSSGNVSISLFTVAGKLMATPVNRAFPAGSHRIALGSSLVGGTYLVKMRTGGGAVATERMVVTR